jgi:hypothetical protein
MLGVPHMIFLMSRKSKVTFREDNEMEEEDEPNDSVNDEDSVGVQMPVHSGGGGSSI